ncbi:MAG: RES family NAD+ phosphorylase [bacterium]
MTTEIVVSHDHVPLFQVLRAGHGQPLEASHSRRSPGRWNTVAFPALYACCSESAARAVTQDRLNVAAVNLEELQPEARPQLFELDWSGEVVDVVSAEGVQAVGLSAAYPADTDRSQTQSLAAQWHDARREGVLCRSASLWRLGFMDWSGDHARWGEVTVFVGIASSPVSLRGQRHDLDWFRSTP